MHIGMINGMILKTHLLTRSLKHIFAIVDDLGYIQDFVRIHLSNFEVINECSNRFIKWVRMPDDAFKIDANFFKKLQMNSVQVARVFK